MATNILPDRSKQRRSAAYWLAVASVVGGLLALTTAYVRMSLGNVAAEGQITAGERAFSPAERQQVIRALGVRPLRQSLFLVSTLRDGHSTDDRWLNVLRRLGWRSSAALRTILIRLIARNDLPGALDVLDALLRRGQMFGETAASIQAIEALPQGRSYVVGLLRRRPSWRHDYLLMTDHIKDETAALGRYDVLLALRRLGSVDRDEVAPILPVLIRFGHPDGAWQLWRSHVGPGKLSQPLNDPDFRIAINPQNSNEISVPFEWQIATGVGFSTEPYLDSGAPKLGISWDGRGTPVFASQNTSAQPGMYRLDVSTNKTAAEVNRILSFKLRCPDTTFVDFEPAIQRLDVSQYRSKHAITCAFPIFEISGAPQTGSSSNNVDINYVRLVRIMAQLPAARGK